VKGGAEEEEVKLFEPLSHMKKKIGKKGRKKPLSVPWLQEGEKKKGKHGLSTFRGTKLKEKDCVIGNRKWPLPSGEGGDKRNLLQSTWRKRGPQEEIECSASEHGKKERKGGNIKKE